MLENDQSVEQRQAAPQAARADEPRVGVYICSCGGNIGDTVHCEQVAGYLGKLPNVVVARPYMFMCSDPGQELITEDIREKGVNRVVVGACSMFLHEQTFRRTVERAGLNPYLYTHIGLREQDSWVHHECPAEATQKAIRMLSAGIAKARLMSPLEPICLNAEKHALVIGGGVAGLRAALDIARRGLKVTLVEQNHFLGGRVAQLDHVFPNDEDARSILNGLIEKVLAEPDITIHTGAKVEEAKGFVGNFQVRIRQQPRGVAREFKGLEDAIAACPVETPDEFNTGLTARKAIYRPYAGCTPSSAVIDWEHCTNCGECLKFGLPGDIHLNAQPVEFEIKAGAVVMATGFRPYEPFHGELGYGNFPQVVTLPQLERMLALHGSAGKKLEWNGRPVRSMAMIHCVGSRQVEEVHQPQPDGNVNNYCSRVCCTATLNAANQIRKRFPQMQIFDIYQDIRTYGRGHEEIYTLASKNRVTFLRYLAEEPPDIIQLPDHSEYPILVKVKDHLTWGKEIEIPVDLVVLAVGMMPNPIEELIEQFKITPGSDRFLLEVHPKLRPVETAVNGIVLAGTAQGPMNIQESCAAAGAAASKVAVLLSQGRVELEPYIAQVDLNRCQGSGECVRVCPQEGAIHLETIPLQGESVRRAVVTAANCNGCGVCVSACPQRALDLQGWRLDEYDAMVDALVADIPALEGVV
jgi:heterodisulfide reductase subunit A2